MIRLTIAAILFISLFVMMRGISTVLRESNLPEAAVVSQKAAPAPVLPGKVISQPTVPEVLPDLKSGYLFNAERQLAGEVKKNGAGEGNDLGIQTDIQAVVYSGSIIGDTFRQAIIAVPGAKGMISKAKSLRWRKTSRPSANSKSIRVKEGDVLSGYTVVDISPDKIVFEKGAEKVEKLLYDPDKQRSVPGRQTAVHNHGRLPARPDVVTRPAGTPTTPSSRRLVITRKPSTHPDTGKVVRRRRRSTGGRQPIVIPPSPTVRP